MSLSKTSQVLKGSPGPGAQAVLSRTLLLAGADSYRRWGCWLVPQTCTPLPTWDTPNAIPQLRLTGGSFVKRGPGGGYSILPASLPGRPGPGGPGPAAPAASAPVAPRPGLLLPPGSSVARARKEPFFMLCLFPSLLSRNPDRDLFAAPGSWHSEQGALREALTGPGWMGPQEPRHPSGAGVSANEAAAPRGLPGRSDRLLPPVSDFPRLDLACPHWWAKEGSGLGAGPGPESLPTSAASGLGAITGVAAASASLVTQWPPGTWGIEEPARPPGTM